MQTIHVTDAFAEGAVSVTNTGFMGRSAPVLPYPAVSLELLFYRMQLWSAAFLSYTRPCGICPRFTGAAARQQLGDVMVTWLHAEFDLQRDPKIWPGVAKQEAHIWRADSAARGLITETALAIRQQVAAFSQSHWYASRGGLHFMQEIVPVPYEEAAGLLHVALSGAESLSLAGLRLDGSCKEPSRLQYVPLLQKPKQGMLDLPRYFNRDQKPLLLQQLPEWDRRSHFKEAPRKLRLSSKERTWAENFAQRWLQSHVKWLESAPPHSGRNSRLYGFAADIRQLADAGICDAQHWISIAKLTALSAPQRPIHDWEATIDRAFGAGAGTGTVAIMYRDLEKLHRRCNLSAQARRILC